MSSPAGKRLLAAVEDVLDSLLCVVPRIFVGDRECPILRLRREKLPFHHSRSWAKDQAISDGTAARVLPLDHLRLAGVRQAAAAVCWAGSARWAPGMPSHLHAACPGSAGSGMQLSIWACSRSSACPAGAGDRRS